MTYSKPMGRGSRDSRLDSTPRATSFIEIYGQSIEISQIDCRLPEAHITIEEVAQVPEAISEILQEGLGIVDSWQGQKSWNGLIELPHEGSVSVEISVECASRELALSSILAVEDQLVGQGSLPGNPETKILSYPSEVIPAVIWAEASLPEIGLVATVAAGDNLHQALAGLRKVWPEAQMPS